MLFFPIIKSKKLKIQIYFLNKFIIKLAFFAYILYSDFKTKYFRMYKNATAYYIDNKKFNIVIRSYLKAQIETNIVDCPDNDRIQNLGFTT